MDFGQRIILIMALPGSHTGYCESSRRSYSDYLRKKRLAESPIKEGPGTYNSFMPIDIHDRR